MLYAIVARFLGGEKDRLKVAVRTADPADESARAIC
jgi:hypothetical protein